MFPNGQVLLAFRRGAAEGTLLQQVGRRTPDTTFTQKVKSAVRKFVMQSAEVRHGNKFFSRCSAGPRSSSARYFWLRYRPESLRRTSVASKHQRQSRGISTFPRFLGMPRCRPFRKVPESLGRDNSRWLHGNPCIRCVLLIRVLLTFCRFDLSYFCTTNFVTDFCDSYFPHDEHLHTRGVLLAT